MRTIKFHSAGKCLKALVLAGALSLCTLAIFQLHYMAARESLAKRLLPRLMRITAAIGEVEIAAGNLTDGGAAQRARVAQGNSAWLPMDDYNAQIHSAFYDTRLRRRCVRLLLYRNHGVRHDFKCRIKFNDTSEKEVQAALRSINPSAPRCPGGCKWRYESYYADCCPDPHTADIQWGKRAPVAVALGLDTPVAQRTEWTGEMALEQTYDRLQKADNRKGLAVCVAPMYFMKDWLAVLTFIEYYLSVGAECLYFYVHSIHSPDVSCVLEHYERLGSVRRRNYTEVPHGEPEPKYVREFQRISSMGQLGAENDCLLRASAMYRYAAFVDVDEFLGPVHYHGNESGWLSRFAAAKFAQSPGAGGLHWRSALLKSDFPHGGEVKLAGYDVSALRGLAVFQPQVTRSAAGKVGDRSKMLVRTESIYTMGVHRVFAYAAGYSERLLPPDEAVIYHARGRTLRRPPRWLDAPNAFMRAAGGEALVESVAKTVAALQSAAVCRS